MFNRIERSSDDLFNHHFCHYIKILLDIKGKEL